VAATRASRTAGDRSTAGPLRSRSFRTLLIGRAVNAFGSNLAPIALAFAVLDATRSATDLAIVVGTRSAVNVGFLLAGGVASDRLPRRVTLLGSSLLAGLAQALVATVLLTGHFTLAVITILAAINGAAAAFAQPASATLLPATVPADQLRAAVSLSRMAVTFTATAGAALGGVIVVAFGAGVGIAVDAGTFAVAGLAFARLGLPELRDRIAASVDAGEISPADPAGALNAGIRPGRTGPWSALRSGWVVFTEHRWVLNGVLATMAINAALVAMEDVLGPVTADASFGRRWWGVLLAAVGVGFLLGGAVSLRWHPQRPLFAGTLCLLGVPVLLLSLGGHVPIAAVVVIAAVAAVGAEQFGVAWTVAVQSEIPADSLGRVYAYDAAGSGLAGPLAIVAAGALAGRLGSGPVLLGFAAVAALSVLALLLAPGVATLRRQPG
jgi:MFS family permease